MTFFFIIDTRNNIRFDYIWKQRIPGFAIINLPLARDNSPVKFLRKKRHIHAHSCNYNREPMNHASLALCLSLLQFLRACLALITCIYAQHRDYLPVYIYIYVYIAAVIQRPAALSLSRWFTRLLHRHILNLRANNLPAIYCYIPGQWRGNFGISNGKLYCSACIVTRANRETNAGWFNFNRETLRERNFTLGCWWLRLDCPSILRTSLCYTRIFS